MKNISLITYSNYQLFLKLYYFFVRLYNYLLYIFIKKENTFNDNLL